MYNQRDIAFSKEGDIELTEDGDFRLATPMETVRQDIFNRINTNNPDWFRYPHIGANLEDIFGKDNSIDTAEEAINKAEKALTHDDRFSDGDINVDAVPTGPDTIELFVFVNTGIKEELVTRYPIRLR